MVFGTVGQFWLKYQPSAAVPGALAQCLQPHTACKIQYNCRGANVEKGSENIQLQKSSTTSLQQLSQVEKTKDFYEKAFKEADDLVKKLQASHLKSGHCGHGRIKV